LISKLVAAHTTHSPADDWGQTWHAVFDRSFLPSADLFSFGMAAAVVVIAADAGSLQRWKAPWAGAAALLSGAIVIALHTKGHIGVWGFTTAMGLCFGALVLWVALPRDPAKPGLTRVLETRVAMYVGVISYSIYLWHEPMIFFLRKHGLLTSGKLSFATNVIVVLGVTVALSAITYRFVEAQAMRHKVPLTRRPAPVAETVTPEALGSAPSAVSAAPVPPAS
jgi:peptidoglycan/LPS O-acetylase OafA/YrhL